MGPAPARPLALERTAREAAETTRPHPRHGGGALARRHRLGDREHCLRLRCPPLRFARLARRRGHRSSCSPTLRQPFEARLVATLTLAGVRPSHALVATLLYRLIAFWLPIPIGGFAFTSSDEATPDRLAFAETAGGSACAAQSDRRVVRFYGALRATCQNLGTARSQEGGARVSPTARCGCSLCRRCRWRLPRVEGLGPKPGRETSPRSACCAEHRLDVEPNTLLIGSRASCRPGKLTVRLFRSCATPRWPRGCDGLRGWMDSSRSSPGSRSWPASARS